MTPLEQYQKIKRDLDSLTKQENKLQGAWEQDLKDLLEFGCESTEDAERLLTKNKNTLQNLEKELARKTQDYEIKWSQTLKETQ